MHSLLKHKKLQFTLKISLYVAPTCFGSFGPSSGSIRQNLVKVTVFLELLEKYVFKIVVVQWQYVLQSVVCVLGGVVAQHPINTLLYRLKHVLPLHSNNFNDVFLLTILQRLTLEMFCRMLPDDGPNGPKHVGAI
jgi:hypothetical protein